MSFFSIHVHHIYSAGDAHQGHTHINHVGHDVKGISKVLGNEDRLEEY